MDSPSPLWPMKTVTSRSRNGNEGDSEKGDVALLGALSAAHDNKVSIRWNMVFTWQAPIMLLAYSMIAFLVGLTVYVCKPLYNKGSVGREAAIFYLASLAVGGFCFVVSIYFASKPPSTFLLAKWTQASDAPFGRTSTWIWKNHDQTHL
ncbi:hypothetical protein F5Y06DRAFT_294939 [Hypoxylon sp. FL0890]|nr:hypothetical protein F5Y06DRAFT_294939 [Hypoxylon sp. FL0890]